MLGWLTRLVWIFVGVAVLLAGIWAFAGIDLEPWIALLALVAGALQFVVQPRLEEVGRRRRVFRELAEEMWSAGMNLSHRDIVVPDGRPKLYGRAPVAATEAAITSGMLSNEDDRRLYSFVRRYAEFAARTNQQMMIVEFTLARSDLTDATVKAAQETLRDGLWIQMTLHWAHSVVTELRTTYRAEVGDASLLDREWESIGVRASEVLESEAAES